jgi:hypothetical protein
MSVGGQPGANPALQMGASPDRRLQATTISLPQTYQMPDAAALNAAMQSAGYQAAPPQMAPNALPTQMQMQAAPIRGYNQAAAPAVNPAVMNTQPYANNPSAMQQATPASTPMYPGVQAIAQQPVGANPLMGQVQQQSYQQPAIQPPMVQTPMMQAPPIRQPQPVQQSWQQQPSQLGPAAMNSPAGVLYR